MLRSVSGRHSVSVAMNGWMDSAHLVTDNGTMISKLRLIAAIAASGVGTEKNVWSVMIGCMYGRKGEWSDENLPP